MNVTRRRALKLMSTASIAAPALLAERPKTDIRVEKISYSFQDFQYRAPYKFGGRAVDRVTLLNVDCV